MATLTVYASLNSGRIVSQGGGSYYSARMGYGDLLINTSHPRMNVGQFYQYIWNWDQYDNDCYQSFLAYDTSSLAGKTITSVKEFLYCAIDSTSTDYTQEVRLYDWGATLTTSNFRAGNILGNYTLLSSKVVNPSSGYNEFPSSSNFISSINKTGYTRLFHSSSRQRLNQSPSGSEYVQWLSANDTSAPPYLQIEYISEPSVSTTSATSITSSTATIGGNITDTGGENPTRYLQWGTTTSMTSSSNRGTGGTGNYTLGLTGLSPATLYYFRAYATNSAGTTYGNRLSFTTDKATQSAPSAPTLSSRTSSSITLNTISGCEYRRGTGAWQDSTTFSGLSPATTYTFYARKRETTTTYASPSSSGANLTTLAALATVTTLSAQNIEKREATIRGEVTNTGGENPTIYFDYSLNSNMSGATSVNFGTQGTGTYSTNLEDLKPNTTYYFRIRAVNSAGTSTGDTLNFTTLKMDNGILLFF